MVNSYHNIKQILTATNRTSNETQMCNGPMILCAGYKTANAIDPGRDLIGDCTQPIKLYNILIVSVIHFDY